MTYLSVSTSGSWSPLLYKTFSTSSTTNLFGQFRWLATTAHTVDSLSSIYACMPITPVISWTSTWSLSPCSSATPLRTCSTWSSSFSTHCTTSGATSWSKCCPMEIAQWPIVTMGSSRAWFDSFLTRCYTYGARHIKLIFSSRLRPNQSWTTLGSISHRVY